MSGRFEGGGSHIARYATGLNCSELNTSFHRSHRREVYPHWVEQTLPAFASPSCAPQHAEEYAYRHGLETERWLRLNERDPEAIAQPRHLSQ